MARIRRTPEEARTLILDAAALRLEKYGIRGLNIKDVAKDAGINHGTLLHHFGSADKMRVALLMRMSENLVADMAEILNSGSSTETLIVELFRLMSQSGQIKLMAWRALEDFEEDSAVSKSDDPLMFQQMIEQVAVRLDGHSTELARNLMFLAVSAAVGWGVCGSGFEKILSLKPGDRDKFPAWVGSQLPRLMS